MMTFQGRADPGVAGLLAGARAVASAPAVVLPAPGPTSSIEPIRAGGRGAAVAGAIPGEDATGAGFTAAGPVAVRCRVILGEVAGPQAGPPAATAAVEPSRLLPAGRHTGHPRPRRPMGGPVVATALAGPISAVLGGEAAKEATGAPEVPRRAPATGARRGLGPSEAPTGLAAGEDPVATAVPGLAVVGRAVVGVLVLPLADEVAPMPGVAIEPTLVAEGEATEARVDVDKKADQATVEWSWFRPGEVVKGAERPVGPCRPSRAGLRPVPGRLQVTRRRLLPRPVEGQDLVLIREGEAAPGPHDVVPTWPLLGPVLGLRQDGRRPRVAAHLGADAKVPEGRHGQAPWLAPAPRQVPLVGAIRREAGDEAGVAQVREATSVGAWRQDGLRPDLADAPEGVGRPGPVQGPTGPGGALP